MKNKLLGLSVLLFFIGACHAENDTVIVKEFNKFKMNTNRDIDTLLFKAISDSVKIKELDERFTLLVKHLENQPPKKPNLLGIVTVLSGITAGIITIADANGTTSVPISNSQKITVNNQWTRYHTIWISLSIGLIAIGIADLLK
jgi:hypothetical protein